MSLPHNVLGRNLHFLTGKKLVVEDNSSQLPVNVSLPVRTSSLLCFILSTPSNHQTRATAVNRTWGPRCDVFNIISSREESDLPIVRVDAWDTYWTLWEKVRETWKYLYSRNRHQIDWYMKADDNTYVIVENARELIKKYDPDKPYYIGARHHSHMAGGPGYILSREALRRFVLLGPKICSHNWGYVFGAEDAEMGSCLQRLGAILVDTRDGQHRGRFFQYNIQQYLVTGLLSYAAINNFMNEFYPIQFGMDTCCSDSAVSFHDVTPEEIYTADYLIYYLKLANETL